jgi:H+/Cl- antiporter ClcA
MAACVVGVTTTTIGSTLVVTEMADLQLLPTTLVASLAALWLTSNVGLIDTQREREARSDLAVDRHSRRADVRVDAAVHNVEV